MKKTLILSLILFSYTLNAQIRIIVNSVPLNTPATDDIYIAGDFQAWNPGSLTEKLTKNPDNTYEITLPSNVTSLSFKFTRGTWPKVESNAGGGFIPNRTYSSTSGLTVYLQIAGWEDLNGSGTGESTAAFNVSILNNSFYMTELDRNRRVWLYLPPDYHTSGKSYPVLYMQDGQNVFDNLTSFSGEWKVDETLNTLHAQGDPGIIVVAIDNGGEYRTEEYSPWVNLSYASGKGVEYTNFIVNELKPFIDANYRTLADRENTGLAGSSLGGLISTFAGIEHQNIFGKIASFSPAYWFNPEAYTHVTTKGKLYDMKIYQVSGGLESASIRDGMNEMHTKLENAGFTETEILSLIKADGQHSEWFWAREFKDAYLWLFRNVAVGTPIVSNFDSDIKLYPNPATKKMYIDIQSETETTIKIVISDTLGRTTKIAYSSKIKPGANKIEINLGKLNLAAGNYICNIHTAKKVIAKKFIISK